MDTTSEHSKITFQLQSVDHYNIGYKYFVSQLRKRVFKDSGKDLIIDEQIETPLKMFVAWALNHRPATEKLGMDPRKGIMLRGNVGSGKTILFRTLNNIKKDDDERRHMFRGLLFSGCEEIAKIYQAKGDAGLEDYRKGVVSLSSGKGFRNYCFDDLGNEEPKNHYGNFREVMKDIVDDRYKQFVDHGLITCFTTNLTMPEIEKRYDKRTASRLNAMCNIIGIGTKEDYLDRRG